MFLKNRNIIFKMKISKVTDYAALTMLYELSLCRTKLVEVFVPGYSFLSFHILALRIVEKQESKILL